jgi:transcriptional regulator with XRE-family HTH domain
MAEKQTILAERLERLFNEVRKPNGSKYTQAEVVEGVHGLLTRVYLWKLRTGRAVNPGFKIIQALADFFGVEAGYFSAAEDLPARPSGRYVEEIQARAYRMDEKGRRAILNLMDYLISLQQAGTLDVIDPETSQSPK